MDTLEKLRARADEAEASAWAALELGDETTALAGFRMAMRCRRLARELEASEPRQRKRLPAVKGTRTIDKAPMAFAFTPEHRANMSKASGTSSKLAKHARKLDPPMTLAEIAEKAGVSPSLISKAEKGLRAMPTRAADIIEKETGWPKANWPRLS